MTICTLLLVALCSFNALAAPIETKTPDISKRDDVNATYRLSGYEGCNAYQIGSIKDGYSDFTYMIDSTGGVFPKYKPFDWNSAVAQDFWGPADRNRLYRAQINGKAQGKCSDALHHPLTLNQATSTVWQQSPMTSG
jgi:hypothetical protein